MQKHKLIYVCSPYGGKDTNYETAKVYGRYVLSLGGLPIIPHTMLHGIADDKNPEHRDRALELGKRLLQECDEVWVFGDYEGATDGMHGEILFAGNIGKPVKYISPGAVLGADERSKAIRLCVAEYERRYLTISRFIADRMIEYLDAGIDADLIIEAVDKAYKKNAQWKYAAAILNACRAKKIRTLDEYRENIRQKQKPGDFAGFDLDAFERKLNSE